MSLTTSLVGGLPLTGGIVGCPFAGGLGLIGAHFVGAAAGLADAVVVGVGVAAVSPLSVPPPLKWMARTTINAITAALPTDAPMIVLRRRRRARCCCSRS